VIVGRGAGVVQSSLTTGVEPLVSNADKTLDVLGASPMGALPRYDLIVFNPASAAIEAVIGTPNASPTDPAAPTGSLLLARIRNAASATTIPTSAIDDLRVTTTLNVPIADPSWTSYTPVWSQIGGTVLNVNSGSLTGKWRANGKQITAQVTLTRAADSNVGTAAYAFSLPFVGGDINGNGTGVVVRGTEVPVSSRQINGGTVVLVGPSGRISNSTPGSWAAGDIIQFTHTYFLP
jgi:hypothetical protein